MFDHDNGNTPDIGLFLFYMAKERLFANHYLFYVDVVSG